MTKLEHFLHGVGLLQLLTAAPFPHTTLTLNLLHPPKVALCASLGLRTEAMCPDNPASTKTANYHGDMCHNSRLWASRYILIGSQRLSLSLSACFTYTCGSFQTSAQEQNADKQQDLQPISVLTADQVQANLYVNDHMIHSYSNLQHGESKRFCCHYFHVALNTDPNIRLTSLSAKLTSSCPFRLQSDLSLISLKHSHRYSALKINKGKKSVIIVKTYADCALIGQVKRNYFSNFLTTLFLPVYLHRTDLTLLLAS